MPASEIGWPSPPTRGPILQVYGTKRKADLNQQHGDMQTEHAPQDCVKRLCTVDVTVNSPALSEQQQAVPLYNNNNNDCSVNFNNNNVDASGQHCQDAMMSDMDMCTDEEVIQPTVEVGAHWDPVVRTVQPPAVNVIQPTVEVGAHWDPVQPAAVHMQTVHQTQAGLMDMNGETYHVDTACAAMDSDCTPDQQQYQHQHRAGASDSDSQFCLAYCGAGDESPTSGRVRCFCKPSWEGMMELRPYISDVY